MAKSLPPDPAYGAAHSRAAKTPARDVPTPASTAARRSDGDGALPGRIPKPSEIAPRAGKRPTPVSMTPVSMTPVSPTAASTTPESETRVPTDPRPQTAQRGTGAPAAEDQSPASDGAIAGAPTGETPRRRPSPLDVISHRRDLQPSRSDSSRHRMPRIDEYSAGGLVVNRRGHVPAAAIIGRTDRRGRLLWSLPKGHIEAGETAVQAAVREVEEETGIVGKVVAPLGKIDYWFVADGRRVHKTVTHFLMKAVGGELSDEDAEVVAVEWVPLDNLSRRLAYADERRIAIDAIRILADIA